MSEEDKNKSKAPFLPTYDVMNANGNQIIHLFSMVGTSESDGCRQDWKACVYSIKKQHLIIRKHKIRAEPGNIQGVKTAN